jgi:hypothetical protein
MLKKIFLTAVLLGFSGIVSAQTTLPNPINQRTFAGFIQQIANIAAYIGGVVAVIMIIWSGFLFVTARGDERKLATAKTAFTWTVIGAAVLLGAYAIATAVIAVVTSVAGN